AVLGGAILNDGNLHASNLTITGNHAINAAGADGGGIANQGTLALANSIVAGNVLDAPSSTEPDIFGPINTDTGHNLLGATLSAATGPGDIFADNPLLTPLGDYGGATPTMAPVATSPALGQAGAITVLTAPVAAGDTTIHVADVATFDQDG